MWNYLMEKFLSTHELETSHLEGVTIKTTYDFIISNIKL